MSISVNFKLVYSEITISIHLPEDIKIIDLHEYIKPYIERTYHINEFNISEAGTSRKENADPIELVEDMKLFQKYSKQFTSFYISKIEPQNRELRDNSISTTQECNICVSITSSQNMFRMNCGHSCCATCIYLWRTRGSNTCPFCRRII